MTQTRKMLTGFLFIGFLIFPLSATSQVIRQFELPANQSPASGVHLLPKFRNFQPRIGLALSGGGSRGLAHIGVLKVFDVISASELADYSSKVGIAVLVIAVASALVSFLLTVNKKE